MCGPYGTPPFLLFEDFGKSNISYDFLRECDKVLEVKYDEFIPDFLVQLLELRNMQQTAYSKYQLCRLAEDF